MIHRARELLVSRPAVLAGAIATLLSSPVYYLGEEDVFSREDEVGTTSINN